MVPATNLLAFALAALVLIAIPGPSVLFVIGRTLALGRRGGLLSVLGNAAGEVVQIAAVALGVGVVLAQSLLLFSVVKFAGAAYLVYLGIQAIRHRGGGAATASTSNPASTARVLREGFIVGATNPKSIVFFVAVLPAVRGLLGRRDSRAARHLGCGLPAHCPGLGQHVVPRGRDGPALVCPLPPADRRSQHHRRRDDDRAGRHPGPRRATRTSDLLQQLNASSTTRGQSSAH